MHLKIFLPPTNNIQVLFKYSTDTAPVSIIPKMGNNATGIKEVTGNGSNSIIHEQAIKSPTYAVFDFLLSEVSVS